MAIKPSGYGENTLANPTVLTTASDGAVVLVSVDFGEPDYAESLHELRQLVTSAGMQVRATVEGKRSTPDAKLFIGSGKADELKLMLEASETSLVAFNHDLSPSQQRNLERLLQAKVLDRTGLILDIFAQRAKSHEGKLQVELAQQEHLSTRLVRGWPAIVTRWSALTEIRTTFSCRATSGIAPWYKNCWRNIAHRRS